MSEERRALQMALILIALLSGLSETARLDVESIGWAHVGSLAAFVADLRLPRIGAHAKLKHWPF
jgi:hypothetical protein